MKTTVINKKISKLQFSQQLLLVPQEKHNPTAEHILTTTDCIIISVPSHEAIQESEIHYSEHKPICNMVEFFENLIMNDSFTENIVEANVLFERFFPIDP